MEWLLDPQIWIALLTLTALEIGARFLPAGFPGIRRIGRDSRGLARPFGEKPSCDPAPACSSNLAQRCFIFLKARAE
jgi:predicted nuclease with RNAse H fold